MSDTFKGIVTADGKKRQLPYGSLLDLPSSDPSLTVEGGFADAAVVGKKNKKTDEAIASLKEDLINNELPLLDTSCLKGTVDNFHRTNSAIEGYYIHKLFTKDVFVIISDNKLTNSVQESSVINILYKDNVQSDDMIIADGDGIIPVFGINNKNNEWFFFRKYKSNGLQLYKRVMQDSGSTKDVFIKNYTFISNLGVVGFVIRRNKIYIYNDFVLIKIVDCPIPYNNTAGMMFIGGNKIEYTLFGILHNVGKIVRYGFIAGFREVSNDGSSISENNGEQIFVLDKSKGTVTSNKVEAYRTLACYENISYDICETEVEFDFCIDENLMNASDYLIAQWHDAELLLGMNPIMALFVIDNALYLNAYYNETVPNNSKDYFTSINHFKINDVDYGKYHHIYIRSRLGYDGVPYVILKYDNNLVYCGRAKIGYKGQNGHNFSYGIYGWFKNGDWNSNSNICTVKFKNMKYIT